MKVAMVVLPKPVPVRTSVNAAEPADTREGEMDVNVSELLIVNGSDCDAPLTITIAVPGLARRFAGTVAVICVADSTWLCSGTPFQRTWLPDGGWNPEPVTVMVIAGLPDAAEFGDNPDNTAGGGVMESATVFVVWLPVCTAMFAVPICAIRVAGTEAVNCVDDTNAVGSTDPFHRTMLADVNPEPFAVNWNCPPPTTTEPGDTLVSERPACVIWKLTEFES